jgi:TolB protein
MENYDIYTAEPDGSNLTRLTNSNHWESRPIWSPDGTQMTFSDNRGDVGIPVMSAEGSNLRYIPTDPNITGSLNFFPTWSADGTKLAFSGRDSPDTPFDIFTMDLDGANQINLTNTSNYSESDADFSPVGSQMCFLFGSDGPKPPSGMYLMRADGSDPTLLIEEGGQCDWSPDGTKIVLGYSDFSGDTSDEGYGDSEVAVINADGSGLTNLTSNSVGDFKPRWSPDGTKITFMSDRSGDYDIYTMNANGSNVAPVTTNPRWHDMDPDWQPVFTRKVVAMPEKQQEERQQNRQVHLKDTGGPSLLFIASALLFSGGVMFYAGVQRRI